MYVAFLVVMPLVGRLIAGALGLDVGESRALALALPAGYELAPAVVVTQTLVELSGMVLLTRLVPAWLVSDRSTSRSTSG